MISFFYGNTTYQNVLFVRGSGGPQMFLTCVAEVGGSMKQFKKSLLRNFNIICYFFNSVNRVRRPSLSDALSTISPVRYYCSFNLTGQSQTIHSPTLKHVFSFKNIKKCISVSRKNICQPRVTYPLLMLSPSRLSMNLSSLI